ncbi:MAG TPA: DUF3160 domain-containing protein, partial [Prolixibacteraceae bacterium]|nr:DUF3160 domain-containing protein [Prolixibacteraceae bacterium]
ITSAVQLTDTTVFKALKRSLGSDPGLGQKILSDFFLMDPWAEEPGVLPVSYRLSGQRFIIDSYILGSMVFDKVVFNGEKVMRMMPKPLDAIFALGNNDALPLLRNELEKYPYAGQLANMRYLTDAKPLSFWEESLYNVWLNALRDLNPGPDEQAKPLFMQTAAWHQEKMNTQLASWSHLRHDNLLYAKQSYTGGTGCSFPWSYVEPYPAFYGRLKSYATDAAAFFSSLPISSPEINRVVDFFPRFGEVMEKLETLAVKELDKVPFSQEENQWLQTMLFHKSGSGIPPYTGWYADLFFDTWDTSEGDFTIVDIHTQPTDESGNVVGRVLHTGVGQVNLGVFLSNHPLCPDRMMAFAGPVLSYYEKTTSGFQRMTDQEWETMVWQGKMPERPDWTNMYLAGITGAMRAKGAELPYQFYTGTSAKPLSKPEILVYPNPVGDQLFISFRTHVNTRATISLYNGSGTLVKVLPAQQFLSGENSLTIPFHDMPEGIYLLRIMTENGPCTVSKVIKN